MNRCDPYTLDSRDRLLLVHARMLRLQGKAKQGRSRFDPDVWDAIGELAAAVETIARVQLEKTP
jgi:hypothetical protein